MAHFLFSPLCSNVIVAIYTPPVLHRNLPKFSMNSFLLPPLLSKTTKMTASTHGSAFLGQHLGLKSFTLYLSAIPLPLSLSILFPSSSSDSSASHSHWCFFWIAFPYYLPLSSLYQMTTTAPISISGFSCSNSSLTTRYIPHICV